MNKSLKYINIEYSECDLEYINELCNYIDKSSEQIINFFDATDFSEKVNLILWNNLKEFREFYKKTFHRDTPIYVSGFSKNNSIHILSLNEYKKIYNHRNSNLDDLNKLIIHEFIHSVHSKFGNIFYMKWLTEGLATTLSHQYDNIERKFDISLEQLLNDKISYVYYYTMLSYILENYGRDYVLKLIKDTDYLIKETSRLYEEVRLLFDNKNINNLLK